MKDTTNDLRNRLIESLRDDLGLADDALAQVDARLVELNAERAALVADRQHAVDQLRALGEPIEEEGFPCRFCDRPPFPTAQGRNMHVRRAHPTLVEALLQTKPAVETVTIKATPEPVQVDPSPALDEPVVPNPGPTPFKVADDERAIRCDDCDAAYPIPRDLFEHVKAVHGRPGLSRGERVTRTLAQARG